jgi:radical SAM superfamily enzyme YgiQ (UPF0313 family)
MRICLINNATGAEYSDPTEFRMPLLRDEVCQPQLGVLSLAAVLERHGLAPSIIDLNRLFFALADAGNPGDLDDFVAIAAGKITAAEADVYGFSTICSAYPITVRIAREVKRLRSDSVIVLGGPQASVVSRQTLEAFPWVDFILRGEAERSLPEFLAELAGSKRFDQVQGLTYRSPFGVQMAPDAPVIQDLDELPFPAYHLTDELRGKDGAAALEIGRGCPFACTFCSTNDFFRRKFRLRSPERVIGDMRFIDAEYGIRTFALTHDMFTVDHRRVRAFCQAMLDSGTGYTWSCSARTDSVDEELLELMAAAGCTAMFFGVETGSQRMQKIIDKHLDVARAHRVIDSAERAGIGSTISLIMGFPEETISDLRDTVSMFMHSARTPGSNPQLNLLSPLANTPIHRLYKDQITLEPLCSDTSHQGCRQHPEDIGLIRSYPDIFPNFYLVPTPEMDRTLLLELREFARMAEARFRWLLGAADQATDGMLDIFFEWKKAREVLHPGLSGQSLRRYYRDMQFVEDFVSFLRTLPASSDPAVSRLMEFEESVARASSAQEAPCGVAELDADEELEPSDIPCRRDLGKIVEVSFDLQLAIDAVKQRQAPGDDGRLHFYFVKQAPGINNNIYEVSPGIARAAGLCDGERTVEQIAKQLSEELPDVVEEWRPLYAVGLIERDGKKGFLRYTGRARRPSQARAPARLPVNTTR